MKIQKVKIKNFKVINDLEFDLNGQNIILLGDNEVGKSSFIQAIKSALGHLDNMPVNSETEVAVFVNKDGKEVKFNLKVKNGKPVIEVEVDGLRDVRKSAIQSIVGGVEFDIDEFVKLSDSKAGQKKQVEIFKSLLPAEVIDSLDKIQASIDADYNERTDVNRTIKQLEGFINESGLTKEDFGKYVSKIDTVKINAEYQAGIKHNQKVNEVQSRYLQRDAEIKELENRLALLKQQQQEAEAWLKSNKLIDLTKYEAELNLAYEYNAKVDKVKTFEAKRKELYDKIEYSEKLTVRIEENRKLLEDAIKSVQSPIDGLWFSGEVLTYKGVEVSRNTLSESQIMELGIRMKLAQNPGFDILLIENGQNLGLKKLREIQKMGYQIIMEQVERGTEELKIEIMPEY